MTATTSYQAGELVLALLPHTNGQFSQVRPALVLLDTGDADVILARVTTQWHPSAWDIALAEWRQAGLLRPSAVRLHKLLTLDKSLVRSSIGLLTPTDRQQVAAILNRTFANW